MTQIFVGGFGGSGTRVVQMILERAGYDVGAPGRDGAYDWHGARFSPFFDTWYFNRCGTFRSYLTDRLANAESFAVKHGHLMYCIPELHEWFPGSQFIYVYRNPWDQMSNLNQLHTIYGGLPSDAPLTQKVEYWCQVSRGAMAQADLSVSLERLVATPRTAIQEILDIAQVDDAPEKYTDIIQRPTTMGRAQDSYHLMGELPEDIQRWLAEVPGV
jgi:hypothetical protein